MKLQDLTASLNSQGKHILANVIDKFADYSIENYSKYLWDYNTDISLEPELVQAFKMEFTRLGIDEGEQDKIIESLVKYRTLQTAPHTGLMDSTSVPAFTMHYIGTKSLPDDAYYVVGTFSGIPFGNDSYPGAISFSKETDFEDVIKPDSPALNEFKKKQSDRERDVVNEKWNRISLYDKSLRDELVYRSTVPQIFKDNYNNFSEIVADYLVYKDGDTDFTKVMLNSVQKFSRNLFRNDRLVYIDINEVITNYLTLVLNNKDHFIYKMFFDAGVHKQIIDTWSRDAHFFYDMVDSKNGKKQVHAYIDDLVLKNGLNETELTPEILIKKLKDDRLCPGVFIGFTILAFLNGFQCFGSFKQVGYLSEYKDIWMKSNLLGIDISSVRTDSLTTGTLPHESEKYYTAIDILLGKTWQPNNYVTKFSDIITGMEERLLAFKN